MTIDIMVDVLDQEEAIHMFYVDYYTRLAHMRRGQSYDKLLYKVLEDHNLSLKDKDAFSYDIETDTVIQNRSK